MSLPQVKNTDFNVKNIHNEIMDTYKSYKTNRDKAWQILIDLKLVTFPIDIFGVLNTYNIYCLPFSKCFEVMKEMSIATDKEALAFKYENYNYIFYDENIKRSRLRFSMAHEFGHILNNHLIEGMVTEFTDEQETETNVFASRLLMPSIVCSVEKLYSVLDLMNFFGVGFEAATYRAERMNKLRNRNKFLTSPIEREYFNLYKNSNKG